MSEKSMFTYRRRLAPALGAVVCTVALAATAACSSADAPVASGSTEATTVSGSAGVSGDESGDAVGECADPTVELIDLKSFDDAEPMIRMPLPAGWERNTTMDSEFVRGTINAPDLADEDQMTMPVINVVIEDAGAAGVDADEVIDFELASLEQIGATINKRTPIQVCGLPAERFEVTAALMGPQEVDLTSVVIVYESGSALYAVVVTAQGPDTQDPQYLEAVDTVIEQIQVLPAGGAA